MPRQEAGAGRERVRRRTVAALAAQLLAASCERMPPAPQVTVEHAVVTLPAVPGRPGAAYFTLRTNRDATRLIAVESPQVGRLELHETRSEGGVSRMVPLRDPTFSPDAPLVFAPGGAHAMLFGIDPALRVGDRLTLTFRVEPAPPATIEVEVRAPGDARHDDH